MEPGIVVSLGSINVDLQMRVERAPATGETLIAWDFIMQGGGKGANVAFLARRLGVGALLLARAGDDYLGDRATAGLAEAGVDLRGLHRAAGEATGVSTIFVR